MGVYTCAQLHVLKHREDAMSQEVARLVDELFKKGFGYIPINAQLINNAKSAAQIFIDSLEGCHVGWDFTRQGESSPDVGVIEKIGKDIKTYFHSTHDMPLLAHGKRLTSQQRECLRVMDLCRRSLETLGLNIAAELETCFENVDLKGLMLQASRMTVPYNVSTLRILSYPDVRDQRGASPHYDRSFISIHLGDSGGHLLIQNGDGAWERASPPQGSALVFCGVKVLELTKGRLKPVLHKSTTIRGKERTAAVMFVHADIGHPVSDAQKEYERFYAK
jgi:hypothetical protein